MIGYNGLLDLEYLKSFSPILSVFGNRRDLAGQDRKTNSLAWTMLIFSNRHETAAPQMVIINEVVK